MEQQINPHNITAEENILGSILLENDAIRKINLAADDFYIEQNRSMYRAMAELSADGLPIEFASLQAKGIDVSFIARIFREAVTVANINYNADLVRDAAIKRRLRKICLATIEKINTEEIENIIPGMRQALQDLTLGRGGNIISCSEIAKEVSELLERRSQNKNALSGITSGFDDIDEITDGFQGGDLIILAARPGQGKSALAMSFAQSAKQPVGFISIEMASKQLGIRTISSLSQIELWKLRKGVLSNMNWSSLTDAFIRMAEMPVYFSFSAKSVGEIEKTILQMVENYGCKMVIVDYLQLTKGTNAKKKGTGSL